MRAIILILSNRSKAPEKSGAWFSYGDLRLGQGRENVKAYFEQNPEFAAEIEEKIRQAMKGAEEAKSAPKAAAKPAAGPRSVEAAKARLDVTVDDDDD